MNGQEAFPIYSVLDNVRSMYNVGSIFRTSDAARISKLMLCGITASPPRAEIDKTALGSVASVPWQYYERSVEALEELQSQDVRIVIVERNNTSVCYKEFQGEFPSAFVFGHEVYGVSSELSAYASGCIEIPMYGVKESLNIAVAYGIIMYEFLGRYLAKTSSGNP